jgi:hypothetical protein
MGKNRLVQFVAGTVLIAASIIIPGSQGWMTSIGISLAVGALASRKLSEKQGALTGNSTSPNAGIPVVYGRALIGASIVDIRVDAADNKRLVIVAALCVGSQDGSGINTSDLHVQLDGRAAIASATHGNAPQTAGVQISFQKSGTYYLHYGWHSGTDAQTVDTELNSLFPTEWPSTSKGTGIAYLVLILTHNNDVYTSGIPTITASVKGVKVYDPRDLSTAWSDNPALCIRDYLTSVRYGCGIPDAEIDDASFIDAANYCDEIVNTTAVNQKRFRCNGGINTNRSRSENLRDLLSSCRGQLVYQSGQFRLVIRKPTVATSFELTEDNIVGDWELVRSGAQVPNAITAEYVDEIYSDSIREVSWPEAGQVNGFLAADNDMPSSTAIQLPFTQDYYMAQQIAMVTLREAREDLSIAVTAKEEALKLQVGDVVPLTHSTPDFDGKEFWVDAIAILPTAEVRLALREYDANAYSLDTQNTDATVPADGLPDPFTVATPTSLTLTSNSTTALATQDGQYVPRIKAAWTASTHPFLHRYEVQYRKTADSDWIAAPDVLAGTDVTFIAPVTNAVNYTVRVRAINTLGVASDWVTGTITTSTQAGSSGATKKPSLHWANSNGLHQSGATGTAVAQADDPDHVATALDFMKALGGEDFDDIWLSTWDSSSGTAGVSSTLLRTEGVTIDAHNARIRVRLTYVIGGQTFYDEIDHTFDPDTIANIKSCDIKYGSDGSVRPNTAGDEDTKDLYITVTTDGSTPADPDAVTYDGRIIGAGTGTSGQVITTVIPDDGNTVKVKARGRNTAGGFGPVFGPVEDVFTRPVRIRNFSAIPDVAGTSCISHGTNELTWDVDAPSDHSVDIDEFVDNPEVGSSLLTAQALSDTYAATTYGYKDAGGTDTRVQQYKLIVKDGGGNIVATQLSEVITYSVTFVSCI